MKENLTHGYVISCCVIISCIRFFAMNVCMDHGCGVLLWMLWYCKAYIPQGFVHLGYVTIKPTYWDTNVIAVPSLNFNAGLIEPTMDLERVSIVTHHTNMRAWFRIHDLTLINRYWVKEALDIATKTNIRFPSVCDENAMHWAKPHQAVDMTKLNHEWLVEFT